MGVLHTLSRPELHLCSDAASCGDLILRVIYYVIEESIMLDRLIPDHRIVFAELRNFREQSRVRPSIQ